LKSLVKIIDHMGDDLSIAQAARASYQGGTTKVNDDYALIRSLMRREHYSPFAMATIKVFISVPIAIGTQWLRHDRFHFNFCSARYSEMIKDKWAPESPSDIRVQSKSNKQSSIGSLYELDKDSAKEAFDLFHKANSYIHECYEKLIELGVPREQARFILPNGQYTNAIVTANLGDWMMFLNKRLKPDAQKEIRDCAEMLNAELKNMFPHCMQAFEDYQLHAVKFSQMEMQIVKQAMQQFIEHMREDKEMRMHIMEGAGLTSKTERIEFFRKFDVK
jgi:thymidylate synthase (FAD)